MRNSSPLEQGSTISSGVVLYYFSQKVFRVSALHETRHVRVWGLQRRRSATGLACAPCYFISHHRSTYKEKKKNIVSSIDSG